MNNCTACSFVRVWGRSRLLPPERMQSVSAREVAMKITYIESGDFDDAVIASSPKDYFLFKVLPVLTRSAVVGVVVGVLITLFNLLLELSADFAVIVGEELQEHQKFIALYFVCMILIALFMAWFTKKIPEARGSGIPRTEAMMCGKKEMKWWTMCFATVAGSCVSFIAGIPVGAEGPSVQFGGGLGAGIEECGRGRILSSKRYVANSGVAAGVAGAFIAPFTGILFVIEEVQRKFNPLMLASVCTSVMFAISLRNGLGDALGMKEIYFEAATLSAVPDNFLWISLIAGIFAALAARLFNISILATDNLSAKSRLPRFVPLVVLFVIVAVVNIFVPDNIGGGTVIINGILDGNYDWSRLLMLLAIKFCLVVMVFRAAPTGGMMVPMLALGAILGALVGFIGVAAGMSTACVPVVALITMCAFFGSCIGAPLTVVALFAETTGRVDCLLSAVIAIFVSAIISRLLKQPALYDTLWEREIHRDAMAFVKSSATE